MGKNKQYLRTCIACGKVLEQGRLTRFTWGDDKPVQDQEKKNEGRGAYCCDNEACYAAFFKNTKRWKRAFRL